MDIFEKKPRIESEGEPYPDKEVVLWGMEDIIGDADWSEVAKIVDDYGLYSLEVESRLPDGRKIDLFYTRTHEFGENREILPSRILTAIYGADEMPEGEGPQLDYEGGRWVEKIGPKHKIKKVTPVTPTTIH